MKVERVAVRVPEAAEPCTIPGVVPALPLCRTVVPAKRVAGRKNVAGEILRLEHLRVSVDAQIAALRRLQRAILS